MKDNHLLDALGTVDPDLIAEAAPKHLSKVAKTPKSAPHQIRWRRWIPVLAAMLVVAILAGAMLGGVPGLLFPETQTADRGHNALETEPPAADIPSSYRLSTATYPLMAKYPTEGYDREKYNAWRESVQLQESYRGAGENLDSFFEKTILQFLSGAGTENAVYSPLNVYLALAMLAETTAGESRQQILDLLECDSIEDLRTQVHAIWNANYRDDGVSTSILANSVWMDQDLRFVGETIDTLTNYYYASVFRGRMGEEAYNQELRDWMNEQTGGLLEDQINGLEMDPNTILSLISTVYYTDEWDSPFWSSQNTEEVFYGAGGEQVCEMMRQIFYRHSYYDGNLFSSITLGMRCGNMVLLLPDEGVSVDTVLSDDQAMAYILGDSTDVDRKAMEVHLSIPKFDVEDQMDLIDGLKALGVTDCFHGDKTDFSNLLNTDPFVDVYVSSITHGARVVIDEKGCRAAAYTKEDFAGDTGFAPLERIEFKLNRPFIFVLRNSDGLPLFVGVVNQVNG